ncbi:MAG: AAA family ATPase [Candidatus Pacebacteria bacterium]|nr:AAA family ATPase [Candidatus Paceibacterota bacterium]
MLLKRLEVSGFKSFAKKTSFDFDTPVVAIVGPNGSGKSNVAESIRFVLGEQSMKSLRSKRGEDLIWNGSTAVPRAGRASASIVFDNASRFLNIDFDEVSVERTVHRDGINEYRLNGSVVRLKDIHELMAGANIGQSGHHIISQGEADKILSASVRDRREMLEDALGLKVYQYKKDESVRKLEKTDENLRQVEALRREIAPHLRFLKKQVEKLEKAEEMRSAAVERYKVYFKREDDYLTRAAQRIGTERAQREAELSDIAARVQDAKRVLASASEDTRATRIIELSRELDAVRGKRAEATRKASRLQGEIQALQRITERASVNATEVTHLADEGARATESLRSGTLEGALDFLTTFIGKLRALTQSVSSSDSDIVELKAQLQAALQEEEYLAGLESQHAAGLDAIRAELESARAEEREKERALFELTTLEREARHQISQLSGERERLRLEEEEFKRELAEAAPLLGREILSYATAHVPNELPREEQEREKRDLEKIKIRLEETGLVGSDDVLKEYKEAAERDAFLEKETGDLTAAAAQLRQLIVELDTELSKRFDEGLAAINTEFTKFFGLLFDGGMASLVRMKEEVRTRPELEGEAEQPLDEAERQVVDGIDIALTIPRKRIKSLVMLSGGERALTSIALIFAMSSVNPPPFVVLDETDAALDEANSKRYADMVKALSDKSQLVVITHNRETMSRAGILYGVTMGGDGVSKVLSVKLEEAVQVAK